MKIELEECEIIGVISLISNIKKDEYLGPVLPKALNSALEKLGESLGLTIEDILE